MEIITASPRQSLETPPAKHYLNNEYGIKSWLLTQDHKRIAILYLLTTIFFFMIGGLRCGPHPA